MKLKTSIFPPSDTGRLSEDTGRLSDIFVFKAYDNVDWRAYITDLRLLSSAKKIEREASVISHRMRTKRKPRKASA